MAEQAAAGTQSDRTEAASRPAIVTGRALLLGSLGALAVGLGGPWVDHVIRGSYMTLDFSTAGAIFILFALVAVPQLILCKTGSRHRLTTAEIITVYSMMIVASAICTQGLTAFLIPITTGVFYYARPENRWESVVIEHFPTWLAPAGAEVGAPVVRHLYEGLPLGQSPPWGAWLPMFAAWGPFILTLYLVMIAVMVILRRQWVDHERLTYALTQLPLELAGAGSRGLPVLLTNRLFWVGMGVPVLFGLFKGLHFYFPVVPALTQEWAFPVFRNQMSMRVEFSWALLGFFYMVTMESTLGLWVFNRIYFLARGGMSILGLKGTENMGAVGGSTDPYFIHLGTGAFIALVVSSLWVARGHLRTVWECAVSSPSTHSVPVDRGEVMGYRAAVWTVGIGVAFMGWWLVQTGLAPVTAALIILLAFVFYIGITRVVAEVGFAAATSPKHSPNIIISWVGPANLGPRQIVAAGQAYVWCSDNRTFVMASVANSLKTASTIEARQDRLLWGYILAIVIALSSSVWLTLLRAYTQGGITMSNFYFNWNPNQANTYLVDRINSGAGPAWYGMVLATAGGLIYMLLAWARFRYPAWPLHPIGFAIGDVWMMDAIWFTCLTAWMLKGLILHYGGNKTYVTLRPVFLGLICGQFTANAAWLIVDQITGRTGNIIFWI